MCKVKCDKAKLDLDFVVCCVSSIGALQMPSKFSNKLLGNVLLYNREKLNKLALNLAVSPQTQFGNYVRNNVRTQNKNNHNATLLCKTYIYFTNNMAFTRLELELFIDYISMIVNQCLLEY